MAHILVVDDDKDLCALLRTALERDGHQVSTRLSGREVDESACRWADCILLDVMMPGEDGFALCRRIRALADCPILFLTALSDEEDTLLGYELGADDYVTKPYRPQELAARVRSHLRRYMSLGSVHEREREDRLENGRLSYSRKEKTLYVDGEPVKLTATETKILELFLENPGRVFPAEEIYRRVWGEEAFSPENTVMVHIRRIREKIEINSREPEYIKVVWGIGYKMEKK